MFKVLHLPFLLLITIPAFANQPYLLAPKIHDGGSVPFLQFAGPGEFDSYLTMNLPYGPMPELVKQIETREQVSLKTRGEAHITVVTPVEFWHQLKPYGISMKQIDQIAKDFKIQSSPFQIICLGRGEAVLAGQPQQTYYVVVKSEALLAIRKNVQELVQDTDSAFKAESFYSHITIGYTERDLHESDGILKDSNTCIADIELTVP